jgi:tRNA-uridine 2-sulfurtransferase
MRVLVAMSGGVDSSVAAALLADGGHEVVGATMKLWGGPSDSGCCSAADVTDARRVCDALGIDHRVFNFSEEFSDAVVAPYVAAHEAGRTPNPCVACNSYLKFGSFLERARRLGFDAVATGHHARRDLGPDGAPRLRRGADGAKDQSYVLSVLSRRELGEVILPIGELDKDEVRRFAAARGIRVWAKPDSQDVCFITSRAGGAGRRGFLAERMTLHEGTVVDAASGATIGRTDAVELVTVGQRRGLDVASAAGRRFVLSVDVAERVVVVGSAEDLLVDDVALEARTWTGEPCAAGTEVLVQSSAHGTPRAAVVTEDGVIFDEPARRVAPGQVVALYRDDVVVGSGVAR